MQPPFNAVEKNMRELNSIEVNKVNGGVGLLAARSEAFLAACMRPYQADQPLTIFYTIGKPYLRALVMRPMRRVSG